MSLADAVTDQFPASYLQADYFSAAHDARSNDNLRVVFELRGPLDRNTLFLALNHLTQAHDTLRTCFSARGDRVIQRVTDATAPRPACVDVTGSRVDYRALRRVLNDQLRAPFQLTEAPLWRIALIRTEQDSHVLALTFHHSIADAWSTEVLRNQLITLYRAFHDHRQPDIFPLPRQFGDFAAYETGSDFGQLAADWRKMLSPLPPAPRLPDSRQWRPGESLAIAVRSFPRVSSTTAALLRASLGWPSLSKVIHPAAAAAVCPFFDEQMILGVLYSTRRSLELMPLVGPLFDHIPVPVRISKDTSFRDLVRDFAITWQRTSRMYIPLARIEAEMATELGPDRGLYDVEINCLAPAAREPEPPVDGELTIDYFPGLGSDDLDILLAREISTNGRLGFQVSRTRHGDLEGAVFANADAIGRRNVPLLGRRFSDTFALLARYPDDPIRSLVRDLPTEAH